MLFTLQEIQAMLALLNRLPMTPAEQLFAANFFTRLTVFCTPPKPPEDAPPMPEKEQNEE